MNLDLTGKNALVGGSSKGIGKAVAVELALLGASVTLLARDKNLLQQTAAELDVSKGQRHDFIAADFSDREALKVAVTDYLHQTKKTMHILINNTGGPPAGPAIEAQPDAFLSAFSNHLLCNQLLTQLCVSGMKTSGYGRIINIISTSVKAPIRGLGVSNTVRGAVANWAKTLSFELGEFGITVNNVLPGATMTERLANIISGAASKSGQPEEAVAEKMKQAVPLKRFAGAAEVAAAVAFLASPAAAYIHGINLPVDGGRLDNL